MNCSITVLSQQNLVRLNKPDSLERKEWTDRRQCRTGILDCCRATTRLPSGCAIRPLVTR